MKAQNVPFYLIQDASLADRMYRDLQTRILPKISNSSPEPYGYARGRHAELIATQGQHTLTREATVWTITDLHLSICTQLVAALGRKCKVSPEVSDEDVGVIVDRVIEDEEMGLVGWEDKSPAVFRKHCHDAELRKSMGALEIGHEGEKGLRAIIFKVSHECHDITY